MSSERISRVELHMEMARLYGRRSTCPRADVGIVAIRDRRVVAAGYNGAPAGLPHCLDIGCDLVGGNCVRTTHAEANLVAWAARTGTPLEGTYAYCTWSPCYDCAKLLSNTGITGLIWEKEYHPDDVDLWDRLTRLSLPLKKYGALDEAYYGL